ncbi:alpha/beta fold hydrolase [Simiduia curdlanivorans]|uniref:Lipase family alpha/beta hydrolase n=1 Tax=Simiduia curdlanivorans TaxID=1492769 RepID=A0ABV8V6Z5_9GAMM|nr:alpha/beta fold hydrolase [Simiduia curdlanivorans]MDN3638811.1 alpha/beta fold hydrolase [Simiduia curdlanivorans]
MVMPIIIVPGIMGTRLVNSSGRSIWDPDEGVSWGNARGLRELIDLSNSAEPNPRAAPAVEPLLRARGVVNGGNLVWGMGYSNLVTRLAGSALAEDCGEPIKIYCAGYDWRQSNVISARRVVRVIERALQETRAQQVILVAHSMGGMVSRIACRFASLAGAPVINRVKKLILLGSPIHGASKAYRALRQSFDSADDIDEFTNAESIFSDIDLPQVDESGHAEFFSGIAGRALASLVRRLPSMYEMLPTQAFCSANPAWVSFDTARAGIPDASNANRLYTNRFTGINGNASFLRARDTLDTRLSTYLPRQSVLLYSSHVDTEVNFRINRRGVLERAGSAAANRGDGTVPTFSGSGAANRTGGVLREDLRTISHGGLANDPVAIRHIARHITAECQSGRRLA